MQKKGVPKEKRKKKIIVIGLVSWGSCSPVAMSV